MYYRSVCECEYETYVVDDDDITLKITGHVKPLVSE